MYNIFSMIDDVFKYWDRPVYESKGFIVKDTEKGQLLIANVVGIDKDDLKVELVGNTLKIHGETKLEELGTTTKTNIELPIKADKLSDTIEYTLKNGYLYVYLNVKEIPKRDIKIKYKE